MSERIGYVVKRFPRASETFIAQEILELERRGVEVHVLTLWPNDLPARHAWLAELAATVTHCGDLPLSDAWKWLHRRADANDSTGPARALAEAFRYPDRRGRHRLREAVAVSAAAESLQLEHLHAHFANDPAFVAYLAHLTGGLPFSFTAHAKDIYAKALEPAMLRRVVDAAAFAVTVSEDNRRHLAERLGPALANKVLRLYNGVDLNAIEPSTSERRPGPLRLACIARLVEKKGVATLIEALSILDRRGTAFTCTLVGDGPERDKLQAAATIAGLENRLSFLGTTPHEEVIAEIRRSDVLVLPARVAANGDQDALPTVLLEAMAAGVPCVSTAVGGIPEIVVERQTGLLLAPRRALALADALGELDERPQLRRRMGEAGRRRAEKLFDRAQNVSQLHEWLTLSCHGQEVVRATSSLKAVEG